MKDPQGIYRIDPKTGFPKMKCVYCGTVTIFNAAVSNLDCPAEKESFDVFYTCPACHEDFVLRVTRNRYPQGKEVEKSGMKGQGLVEYALILVLVAVVVIAILALLGPAISEIFMNIVSTI
jgi:pilus assembly protein Flp/PilA